jgi:signal transduction histidine kinase
MILVAGILLSSLYFIFYEFKKMNEDELYTTLRSKALMTAEMILHDEDKLNTIVEPENTNSALLPFDDNVVIFNKEWEKVFSFNQDVANVSKPIINENESEIHGKNGDSYTIGIRFVSKKGNPYFIVAESKINTYQVENLRNILIWTFFIIIILVAIGGWLFSGQALAPVSKIVAQVDNILPKNLESRLSAPKSNDEIGKLVATFNNLLERIQSAFTMQKNFISNVSHEIKNPIAVIISQIEVSLGQQQRSSEVYKEALNSILNGAQELSKTTDNLLQLARIHSTEHESLKFNRLQLDEIILAARQNVLKTHKQYSITFDILGNLEDEEMLLVEGNEVLLKSVFRNLLDNACKYSNDNAAEVRLIVGKEQNIVEVIDSGAGIAEADIPLLLQPFYRDPKHKHIRGTGIGLSLVDSILKLHQIPLKINSVEGVGTTFIMTFNKITS